MHEAETQYGKTGGIYRVSRQKVNIPAGQQGTGKEYMDTNGNWYNQSVLRERFKDGRINPIFNEEAARNTHIQVP